MAGYGCCVHAAVLIGHNPGQQLDVREAPRLAAWVRPPTPLSLVRQRFLVLGLVHSHLGQEDEAAQGGLAIPPMGTITTSKFTSGLKPYPP